MITVRKKYRDWDATTRKRLRYATLNGGYLKKFMRAKPDSLTIVAFSQKHIMGWVFVLSIGNENTVNTFVNERYRGKGIATQLIEQTLDIYPEITLCEWDAETKVFFRKLKRKHPHQIKVIEWWDHVGRYRRIIKTLQKPNKE